ncbi:MAG TPA: adenylate/guanylate cyclase domain-containing protein [Desulfobaccales bacterium]|jgi:adenylate cyclase
MKTKRPGLLKESQEKAELNILQAIELAISHELEARKAYLALAQDTEDEELKRLLREIAAEEAGHEASLRSRLRLYEEKHLLRDTISRYVSPEMCEKILKNPALLQLGGRRQQVTVLFADIKSFTAMSETMAPEAVVEVLNTYFTEMVDLVFKHQGTLDKYVGDALMAVFGVPVPLPHAATRAVECALAMQRRLTRMRAEGRTPVQGVRIGINTGEAIVGNIGSDKRMDFTVIGDAVNVAARLQELAKELEADTLISESTYQEVTGRFNLVPEEAVVLRGRKEATRLYRLLS